MTATCPTRTARAVISDEHSSTHSARLPPRLAARGAGTSHPRSSEGSGKFSERGLAGGGGLKKYHIFGESPFSEPPSNIFIPSHTRAHTHSHTRTLVHAHAGLPFSEGGLKHQKIERKRGAETLSEGGARNCARELKNIFFAGTAHNLCRLPWHLGGRGLHAWHSDLGGAELARVVARALPGIRRPRAPEHHLHPARLPRVAGARQEEAGVAEGGESAGGAADAGEQPAGHRRGLGLCAALVGAHGAAGEGVVSPLNPF